MEKKILIVEDEKILLNLLKQKLEREGYEISIAQDGEKGLEKARKIQPNLILLDIIMPKMDGIQFLKIKKREGEIKDIPVIIISNSGQPAELNQAQKLGAEDWLVKTEFNPQEVIKKVKKII